VDSGAHHGASLFAGLDTTLSARAVTPDDGHGGDAGRLSRPPSMSSAVDVHSVPEGGEHRHCGRDGYLVATVSLFSNCVYVRA
jgi:hypothetical protein